MYAELAFLQYFVIEEVELPQPVKSDKQLKRKEKTLQLHRAGGGFVSLLYSVEAATYYILHYSLQKHDMLTLNKKKNWNGLCDKIQPMGPFSCKQN